MESTGPPDPRIPLAIERTSFAKYRTQLAPRPHNVGLASYRPTFATFGFGMVGFFRAVRQANQTPEAARVHHAAIHMGVALILIGIIAMLLSAISHWSALRTLRRGERLPLAKWPLTVTITVLVSVLGLYGLWSLFYG